jgi:hypothetical protein
MWQKVQKKPYYMQENFRNMKADLIPRDHYLEKKISLISRIEYALETSIGNTENIFGCKRQACEKDQFKIDVQIKNANYTIHFNSNFFISLSGFPYLPTLFDLLELPQKNHSSFSIPILSLYVKYWKKTLDEAISDLMDIALSNNKIIKKPPPFPDSFRQVGVLESIFLYCLPFPDFELATVGIHTIYFFNQKKKILLPFCLYGQDRLLVSDKIHPLRLLFNYSLLDKEAIVIITDSIELAGINQRILDNAGVSDITWVSWYGDEQAISDVDWTPLKGRYVYFLLKEHSGLGGRIIYKRAQAVKRELDKVGLKDFNYISFLANGIHSEKPARERCPFPIIYSPEELKKAMNAVKSPLPIPLGTFREDLRLLAPSRQTLMTPFIRERSVSLICGELNAGKTWFSLYLANALSLGTRAFEGWGTKSAIHVLYLHGEEYGYISIEEMQSMIISARPTIDVVPINKNSISDSENMEYCIDTYAGRYTGNNPKLIVIDNLFISDARFLTVMSMMIRSLKRYGWTIIIVQSKDDAPEIIRRLSPDNIIEIKKEKMNDTGVLKMNVKVKSPFPGESKVSCVLDFNKTPLEFKKIKVRDKKAAQTLKKPRCQLISELSHLHYKGLNGPEIALKMSLSLSMVKKLKAEAGISIRRQRRY